jgi:DNA methylase
MAMFPPSMPHVFIQWLTREGDLVYDPFSGRGTTALEACLLQRDGYGSDLNPLGVLLTAAKIDPPTWNDLSERLSDLGRRIRVLRISGEPEHLRVIFADRTLGQLLWLRRELDHTNKTDRFLLAAMAGILHLNARKDGTPRGLSVAMPNTFSMAPRYVMKYVRDNRLNAPDVSVVHALRAKVERLRPFIVLPRRGRAWRQDALSRSRLRRKAALIFASPPYLHVIKYGKLNWLRLWLLGEEPRAVDDALLTTSSVERYLEFMQRALCQLENALAPDGYCCLVIGDVQTKRGGRPIRLAEEVAAACLPGSGLKQLGILTDHLHDEEKVSRIWGDTRGKATKTDRILVLGGPQTDGLPDRPTIRWTDVGSSNG